MVFQVVMGSRFRSGGLVGFISGGFLGLIYCQNFRCFPFSSPSFGVTHEVPFSGPVRLLCFVLAEAPHRLLSVGLVLDV